MAEFFCERCNGSFARKDSLSRHHRRKYPCIGIHSKDRQFYTPIKSDYELDDNFEVSVPCFNGNEFIQGTPKSRETLYKMMKMLRIPERNWNNIANEMMKS